MLVQNGPVGGDCTFTGCVPSKTVIEAARRGASFHEALDAARVAVSTIAATENDEVLEGEGVRVVHGWARFTSPAEIDVDGVTYRPAQVVLATGARPAIPPIPGLDGCDYLTNETVFDLSDRPESLAVLGGGAIGCELAQAFGRLGVRVTLIEGLDRILGKEEPEASAVITDVLRREGIDVRTGAKVVRVEPAAAGRRVGLMLDDGTSVDAERVLVAVGRTPAVDGMSLDLAGIRVERGAIVTTPTLASTVRNVWAVGDVAGKLQFTHAADEMGRLAVRNAFSRLPARAFDHGVVPWVTFTEPEVARIGAAEAEADNARVAYLPMTEVDRAVAAGATDGFVKLIAGRRRALGHLGGGRLVGATIVAERAGEMISEAALAVRTGMFVGRLAQTIHPYPTWSTALRQAAAQFFVETNGRRARPAGSGQD